MEVESGRECIGVTTTGGRVVFTPIFERDGDWMITATCCAEGLVDMDSYAVTHRPTTACLGDRMTMEQARAMLAIGVALTTRFPDQFAQGYEALKKTYRTNADFAAAMWAAREKHRNFMAFNDPFRDARRRWQRRSGVRTTQRR